MKKDLESWGSNWKPSVFVAAVLFCVTFASTTQVFGQRRLGRPPSGRVLEGTAILPAGISVVPDGTVLMIEMDTGLDSGSAQMSDRFLARIATPVVDGAGKTLLQSGTIIEGHVTNVKRAKWAHRSGELGLSFDFLEFGDGRRIPLRGTLVNASNRIDDEGDLRAKSAIKRDVLVTTGGAVAGAGIGMVTGGSILVGGGVGAAAGLTVAMLIKGKNVVIDPGDRFNLQLVQPLSLASTRSGTGTGARQIRTPLPLQPRAGTGTRGPTNSLIPGLSSGGIPSNNPNSVRTQAGQVAVYDVRAERDRDGYLRVLITAETSTGGWRIYTHHEIQPRDTLDIRVRGVPPTGSGARQISHPSAPAVLVDDRNGAIRRIVVRGSNGDRYLTIGSGVASAQLGPFSRTFPSDQPNPQTGRPRPGPSDASPGNIDFPSSPLSTGRPSTGTPSIGNSSRSTGSLSSLATQVSNNIEVLRSNYAAVIGLWVNRDGTVESLGGRRTTANERELYDTLGDIQNSARALAASSIDATNRQRTTQRLQSDFQTAQTMWQRTRSTGIISQDMDRQWQNLQNNLRALISAATR